MYSLFDWEDFGSDEQLHHLGENTILMSAVDELLTIAIKDLSNRTPGYAPKSSRLDRAGIAEKLDWLEQIVTHTRGSVVVETYADGVIRVIAEARKLINARNDYVHGVLRFDEQKRTLRF